MLKRRVSDEVRGVRDVIVMPKEWRRRVLKLAHDRLGHVGSGKTCWSLRQVCIRPGIHRAAKKYVKGCHECQCLTKMVSVELPWESCQFIVTHSGMWQGYCWSISKSMWIRLITHIYLPSKQVS